MNRVLRSRRIVTDTGILDGAVAISGHRILSLHAAAEVPSGAVDLGDLAILPGLVDSHAHLNEPGRTEWEGFDTATRAAAAGGVTTVVDMPLNCIPVTTSLAALEEKRRAVAPHAHIDYAFWGGVVPGNADQLQSMSQAGVVGFKAFLCPSGIDDFPNVSADDLRRAMPILARAQVPLLVHAELESEVPPTGDVRRYDSYLASRPARWEVDAVRLVIELCREFRGPVHIVHLSAADALGAVEQARREGLPITLETCPHYLTIAAEDIADGRTEFKCAPPIRERENQARLWEALRRGAIELVVSNHSPCTPSLKHLETGDFAHAWGGIATLQLSLPLIWTEARKRSFGLTNLCKWMASAPAALAGLPHKGSIKPGGDADLVIFDPDAKQEVTTESLRFRHKLTPYLGRILDGEIREPILRGTTIYKDGELVAPSRGRPA